MAKILEGQTLEVEKMYCFRGKILQREAEQVGKDMEHTIAQLGAKMAAHPITAIYGIEGDQIDMEIRIPIDQEIPSVGKYFYKAKMKIVNAAGRLVKEGTSVGGAFSWDRLTTEGKQAAAGIYYVLATDADGDNGVATKFLIVR